MTCGYFGTAIILNNVDLRGGTFAANFFENVKSQYGLRLDTEQISFFIENPPKKDYEIKALGFTCRAYLHYLNLENIDFRNVKIRDYKITRLISFNHSNFRGANFGGVDLSHKSGRMFEFHYCNFQKANFTRAHLIPTVGCNYEDANFAEAICREPCLFDIAKSIRQVNILNRQSFHSFIHDSQIQCRKNVTGAIIIADSLESKPLDLNGVTLDLHGFKKLLAQGQKNFQGVIFYNTKLMKLNLSRLNFSYAEFYSVDFQDSDLRYTTFLGVFLGDWSTITINNFAGTICQNLPEEYIKLIDSSKTPVAQCLSFLSEYVRKKNYGLFAPDFAGSIKQMLSSCPTFSTVREIREKLEELSRKTITLEHTLLRRLFNFCDILESFILKDMVQPVTEEKPRQLRLGS
jgi:uncharacterized protein YjbI with pentapeptide repeats